MTKKLYIFLIITFVLLGLAIYFVTDVKNGNLVQPIPASPSTFVSTTPYSMGAQVSVITDSAKERQIIEGFGVTHQTLVYGGSLGDTLTPSQRSRALGDRKSTRLNSS